MAIEEVGVKLVAENEAQFIATMKRADNAVDQFGKTAKNAASSNLTKLGKTLDGVKAKYNSFMDVATSTQGVQFAAGVAGSLATAVIGVGYALKKTVDEYVAYNEQVRLFSAATGTAPDQLSRLMQAADDMGVSMGSVQTALQMLSRRGITPTIENIAQLSDRLLAIEDPAERSAQAAKLFGRGWASISAFVLAGGDAIRKGTAAVEDSLVVTDKSIAQSRAYAVQIDQLTDSWTALRYQAAAIILPVAIEGLDKINKEIPQLLSDVMNVYHLFGTLQKGMEQGAIGGADAAKAIAQYLAAEKTAPQIIGETNLAIAEQHNAIKAQQTGWDELSNILGANTTALNRTAYGFQLLEGATSSATSGLQDTTTAAQTSQSEISKEADALRYAGDSAGYFKQQTDKLLEQKQLDFKASLSFSMPDIASQMKNVMDQIDWTAAGGQALQDFIAGMGAQGATINKQLAANIGAVDVALKVETGDLTQQEGVQQIKELFKEVGGIDTTSAKAFIDSVGKMNPPDLTNFLTMLQNAGGQTGKDAAKSAGDLAAQMSTIGTNTAAYGQMYSDWAKTTSDLATNSKTAQEQQLKLGEKIIGTTTAVQLGQSSYSGWNDTTYKLAGNAQNAAAQVGALNTQIKSLPESKTIDIYVVTHGGPIPQAAGGAVTGSTLYLVGEKGPELFVPASGGTIIPANRTQQIVNNAYTIIPMAKGGKIGQGGAGAQEKAHNKMVKERNKKKKPVTSSGGGDEEGSETGDIIDNASSSLEALKAREEFTWSALRASVAQYNAMVKAGASPAMLAGLRQQINVRQTEAQAITQLRQEAEMQYNLLQSTQGDTGEGMQQSSIWLQNLMDKFKDFFALLTSSAAKEAMKIINPLVSSSPAPLAQGLSQIREQMSKLSNGGLQRFSSSVAQLAAPSQSSYSRSSTYNISVPVTATVGNQADIKILAYAVAKEIAANVRA